MVRDPRLPEEERGRTYNSPVLNVDLAEIILSATGLGAPKGMTGRDMADIYLDPKPGKGLTELEVEVGYMSLTSVVTVGPW